MGVPTNNEDLNIKTQGYRKISIESSRAFLNKKGEIKTFS